MNDFGTRNLAAQPDNETELLCILRRGVIAAEACMKKQAVEDCFCPRAPGALKAIEDLVKMKLPGEVGSNDEGTVQHKAELAAALPALLARAKAMSRLEPNEQFAGPARNVISAEQLRRATTPNAPRPLAQIVREEREQPPAPTREVGMPRFSVLKDVTDEEFRAAFAKNGNNIKHTARAYGVSVSATRLRLSKLGLRSGQAVAAQPNGDQEPARRHQDTEARWARWTAQGLKPGDELPIGYVDEIIRWIGERDLSRARAA